MPLNRLFILLAVVISLAAATVALGLIALDTIAMSPAFGLAGLSLLALCAALGWRVYTRQK